MNVFDEIGTKPWNSFYFETPQVFARYPTMLTAEEMRMLSWVATNVEAPGDVIDLGSFLGGSTISLAHGVKLGKTQRKIHAYDKFEVDEKVKYFYLYKRGYPYEAGSDALPIFKRMTAAYHDLIVTHRGDVMKEKSPTPDIAVLFVDVSKSWPLNDHLLRAFFSILRKGAIIVQQDFLFIRNPWLYSTMMKLEPKVRFLGHTSEHSVIFGVEQPLTIADIQPCLAANTTRQDVENAIVYMKKYFRERRQLEIIDACLASYRANPDGVYSWDFANVSNTPFPSSDA